MKNAKKMMALALAASMAMSSSAVAFAAEGDATPGGTGTTLGTGAVEGHVDKEVLSVVLPTVEANKSLFSYTMDPERLIQGTDAAKYVEGAVFPAADADTGVYFLTGENKYENTSSTYQVINKSSCDITLTVNVKATQNTAKDIALATSNIVATTGTPDLYLGLKIGNTDQVVSTTAVDVKKTIAGTPGNFNIAVKEESGQKKYVYQEKADASTWKAMNISMTGSVSKLDIEKDTTAPAVDVTWTWTKAAESDTADTDVVDYVAGPQMSVSTTGLITITGLTSAKNYKGLSIKNSNGGPYAINDAPCTWVEDNYSSENGGSLTCQLGETWLGTLRGVSTGEAVLELTDGTVIRVATNIPAATE